ncbi:ribosomal L1 domain-containing protein 1 [Sceloporus undulatus]|uniref:ribosomal L1 domain-containing protein 1 n=1 Tax=Sceloporus undulatus TaxID=8520 RepID=UPI001C4A8D84|nr:ribosomal L1 domain-containing protein 1 [Sceloporus undulatus]
MEAGAAKGALLPLDPQQIKRAALALLAWSKNKKKTAEKLLLNEDQKFFLMVTVWKIPPREQVIKIPLPHNTQPATVEVCLFTKDEPGLTAEQTENLYKKLLSQHGITSITEVISYKTLKKEYKPFEAKRRLLSRFTLFLSDDRIRRLLPSHIGKHFYKSKKAPLSVNLRAKDLAKEINKHVQGTILPVTNKGCCYSAHIGHTGMDAGKISENIIAAAKVIAAKAPQIWKSVKILHLKTDKSVALPLVTWSNSKSDAIQKHTDTAIQDVRTQKKKEKTKIKNNAKGDSTTIINKSDAPDAGRPDLEMVCLSATVESEEEDREIPQLVPIESSSSVKGKKVIQPSPAPGRKVKPDTKGSPTLLGKRKMLPSLETPEVQPETPGDGSGLQTPKLQRQYKTPETPKQKVSEKKQGGKKQTPAANSSQTPKMVKAVRSSKKGSQTPAQELKKVKVP